MRQIVFWRWIFGFAFVPAAYWTWSGWGSNGDYGLVSEAAGFIVYYLLGLLVVLLLGVVAILAWALACNTWDFILRLLGLRDG